MIIQGFGAECKLKVRLDGRKTNILFAWKKPNVKRSNRLKFGPIKRRDFQCTSIIFFRPFKYTSMRDNLMSEVMTLHRQPRTDGARGRGTETGNGFTWHSWEIVWRGGCAVPVRVPCSGPNPGSVGRRGSSTRILTSNESWAPAWPSPWAARRAGTRTCRRCTCPSKRCSCLVASSLQKGSFAVWVMTRSLGRDRYVGAAAKVKGYGNPTKGQAKRSFSHKFKKWTGAVSTFEI